MINLFVSQKKNVSETKHRNSVWLGSVCFSPTEFTTQPIIANTVYKATKPSKTEQSNSCTTWLYLNIVLPKNKQTNNPFLSGYKNYTEASKEIIAQANKQKAEFQALIKATFSAEKMIKEQQQDWNVVLVNYTKQYKNNKGKPPEISNQELTHLLQDLSDLN